MKWHHNDLSCYFGRNYKRRAHPNLGAVVWVFWHWTVGYIYKPQTLYFGYLSASHGTELNQNELCVSFIHMHVPRPFWGTFSQYDCSCLTLVGRSLPASPWSWYQVKHRSQPFSSGLQGQDKLLVWCESLPIHLVYLCTTCHTKHTHTHIYNIYIMKCSIKCPTV